MKTNKVIELNQTVFAKLLKSKKAYTKNGVIFRRNPSNDKLEVSTLKEILER